MASHCSSRPSSTDPDVPDTDPKTSDAENADNVNVNVHNQEEPQTEHISTLASSRPQQIPGKAIARRVDDNDDMNAALRKKMHECGIPRMRIPGAQMMSGCSDCEETESDEEDDVCSTSSDDSEDESIPPASGIQPPVRPDVQLRVPMENEDDVRRVRASLQIKGVLEVVCDLETQVVTVTGNVAPCRLLKKVRKVKRQSRVLSDSSPMATLIPNPRRNYFDIPSAQPFHDQLAAFHRRPRPTFQSYTFHNSPHSPYLRTYSPPDSSPPASPLSYTGDAFDLGHCSGYRPPYFEVDYY